MATSKATIRKKRVDADGKTPVYIQFSHKTETRYLPTGIQVRPDQFDPVKLVTGGPDPSGKNIKLRNLLNNIDTKKSELGPLRLKSMDMETLWAIIKGIDASGKPTGDFFTFARAHVVALQEENRQSYAATFNQTIKLMADYTRADYMLFTEITPHFLNDLSRKLKLSGHSLTTAAIHFRNLRTLYNKAIAHPSQPVALNNYPFREFKIPKGAGRKLSLQAADIKKLAAIVPATKAEAMAIDMFLLSFYLIGINFKDMLMLKPTDLFRGRIIFDRAKTHKPYTIYVQPEADAIIKRYAGKKYLLNIMDAKEKAQKKAGRLNPLYKDITDRCNRIYKTMHKAGKLPQRISTYYARHTWATMARNLGIPKDDIITALGHGSNTVTDMYIEVDYQRIDAANRKVIDSIK